MPRPLIQFSLADMLAAVLMFGLSVALIRHLEPEPWLLWTLAALAAFCEMAGIVFAHALFWNDRYEGSPAVASGTTALGAAFGLAISPVIVVTVPGFVVLALLVGFMLLVMRIIDRVLKPVEPYFLKQKAPPLSPPADAPHENDTP